MVAIWDGTPARLSEAGATPHWPTGNEPGRLSPETDSVLECGLALYLPLPFVYFFTATRSLALRARGL